MLKNPPLFSTQQEQLSHTKQEEHLPSFDAFYAGKSVAITGGTGCVGQGVVEKLLRCCPDVKRIYLFIRSKRSCTAEERFNKLLEFPVSSAWAGGQICRVDR